MKTAKQREVVRSLEKLGFERIPGRRKELKFTYTHTNDVLVCTVSVTNSQGDIPTGTLNSIRKQMRLDFNNFNRAIKCPFKKEHYIKYIDEYNLAEESPSKN
jgi:predicted RNA binding protein YcfA (HicA-like mRNA interferase family)